VGATGPCTNCTTGTYAAGAASTCTNCAALTYSRAGAAACSPGCLVGEFWDAVRASCVLCAPGHYKDWNGTGVCVQCPNVYAATEITQAFATGAVITKCVTLLYN
jgi:hypothetical protein